MAYPGGEYDLIDDHVRVPLVDFEHYIKDAARWRALMRCGRIKMQGSSGVDPHTGERNGNNVHFGAEFWPEHLPADYREKFPAEAANYDRNTKWGVACLVALADAVLELEDKGRD